jgi:hypothetical protein
VSARERLRAADTPASAPERPHQTPAGLGVAQVLALQRTAGNAAVSRMLSADVRGVSRQPRGAPSSAPIKALTGTEEVRIVERLPTIPEPGVKYVIAQPEKRYDFEVTIHEKPMHFRELTPAQAVEKLRLVWRLLHQDLDQGRAENHRLIQNREEHMVAGYWSEVLGGVDMPDPDMWNEVGRGSLAAVQDALNSTEASLKATWERNEASVDRGISPGLENNAYVQAALAFDATQERIKNATALLERAAADLRERQRRLDEYVEGSTTGARRAIGGIKVTIVVLSASAGGAGASFAGEGAGLFAQAAWGAGTAGVVGTSEEFFSQVGEMRIGEREHFDLGRIAKRTAKDVVTGFVGGVIGGKFAKVVKDRVGGWVGGLSSEMLTAHGIAREELLTNGEKLFIEWVAGNVAASPFTTTAGTLMDRALEGQWKVKTFGEFTDLVFDDMVQSGALGGFLIYAGHATSQTGSPAPAEPARASQSAPPAKPAHAEPHRSTSAHSRPVGTEPARKAGEGPASDGVPEPIHDEPSTQKHVDPEAPVIEESPDGFEPTTTEPPAEDPGHEPPQEELDPEKIGEVESDGVPEPIHDEPSTHRQPGTGTPPSGAPPLPEEARASARPIKRARPYNRRPPRGSASSGGGGRRRRTPKRETRVKQDNAKDYLKHRKFHDSARKVRADAAQKLQEAHDAMQKARQSGGPREIDALIAEIRQTDPAFADQVKLYYEKIEDPTFLEDAMVYLWEQARDHNRTVAEELEHILGGGRVANREFWNTPGLKPEEGIREFQITVRNPRTIIDMSNAGDYHGSHTHSFHQFLGDRIFGPGGGLKFRLKLADLRGTSKTIRPGPDQWEQPFWSRLWDEMFDADVDSPDGLHSPEVLGKILQHVLDFPRWDP